MLEAPRHCEIEIGPLGVIARITSSNKLVAISKAHKPSLGPNPTVPSAGRRRSSYVKLVDWKGDLNLLFAIVNVRID